MCLCHELSLRDVSFHPQVELPVIYKGVRLDCGYRIDLLVEEKVVVEVKSLERLLPVHEAQLLTYMRLGGYVWDCSSISTCPCLRTESFAACFEISVFPP